MNIKECLSRIKMVAESLPDDDPDKIEMMDAEGDYSSLMRWCLLKRREAIANAASQKELSDHYAKRKISFEKKADDFRSLAEFIMNSANEDKFKCDVGSASFRDVKPKPIIENEDLIPDQYFKKVIDKTAINQAIASGEVIDGVVMDNGGRSLIIR